jgi:hypothetical protein
MKATFLNPTLWLLLATAATAAVGIIRRWRAEESFRRVIDLTTRTPILAGLLAVTAVGVTSRLVIAANQERDVVKRSRVVLNRLFSNERVDGRETWNAYQEWIQRTRGSDVPWQAAQAAAGCPAKAMWDRVSLFTPQADTPVLLIGTGTVARYLPPRVLKTLVILSALTAVITLWLVLCEFVEVHWRSREGVLLLSILAGWQPVLAGIRQADVVLPATAIAALAWRSARNRQWVASGLGAALAGCLTLPAVGALLAVLRSNRRAAVSAAAGLILLTATTIGVAGADVAPGYVLTVAYAASSWFPTLTSYSTAGRAIAANVPMAIIAAMVLLALVFTWWRSRAVDLAFGSFLALGILLAPLVWSQHLALAVIPCALVLNHIVRQHRSSASLLGWTLLVVCISLNDQSASRFTTWFAVGSGDIAVPAGVIALVVLWLWLSCGRQSPQRVTVRRQHDPAMGFARPPYGIGG